MMNVMFSWSLSCLHDAVSRLEVNALWRSDDVGNSYDTLGAGLFYIPAGITGNTDLVSGHRFVVDLCTIFHRAVTSDNRIDVRS